MNNNDTYVSSILQVRVDMSDLAHAIQVCWHSRKHDHHYQQDAIPRYNISLKFQDHIVYAELTRSMLVYPVYSILLLAHSKTIPFSQQFHLQAEQKALAILCIYLR